MRYIDLFAGVGGFHYGIDRACQEAEKRTREESQKRLRSSQEILSNEGVKGLDCSATELQQHPIKSGDRQFTCVYSNEWDKYANSVYRRHYGECDNRDIRTVEAEEIPDFDLLCGGFPCQAFSVAGKRGGFEDTRGTLFFEIARIVKQKQPRLLLLENVKGLLSHDQGRTFGVILSTLDELGYDVQWQVLNSKNFGVLQNRERVYIVGHLRGTSRPEVFPITQGDRMDIGEGVGLQNPRQISSALRATDYKRTHNLIKQLNNPTHSNDRVYSDAGISPTLNTMQGGRRQPFVAMRWVRTEKGKEWRRESQKRGIDNTPFNNGYRELVPAKDEIIGTITSQAVAKDSLLGSGTSIRRLTPTECMRLQGFPDDWCDLGVNGEIISDSQKYKMAGNAVTTNVVTEVMRRLL